MRRAHPLSSFVAIVGVPATGFLLAIAILVFPTVAWVAVAAVAGAGFGFAYQAGGGLTSNVRQRIWIGLVSGPLTMAGGMLALAFGLASLPAVPRIAGVGLLFLGAIPGLIVHAVLTKIFGLRSVSIEEWRTLPS